MPQKKSVITGSIASAGSQDSSTPTPTQATSRWRHSVLGPRTATGQSVRPSTDGAQPPSQSDIPNSAATHGANVWKSGGGARLMKSVVTRQGLSVAGSLLQVPEDSALEVASQLNKLSINQTAPYFNPSEAPGATVMGGAGKIRQAPTTQASTRTAREQSSSPYCKQSRWRRKDFRHGDIIALPFHTANMNPRVDPNDERLVETKEGWVYSKRRMLIVMWIHQLDVFCVPLFTFDGKGIKGKPEAVRKEYVSIRNSGDRAFDNQGVYKPVDVDIKYKPMHPMTAVHITGGTKVGFSEDIGFCGRTTEEGYEHLLALWNDHCSTAQSESWRP